MSFHVIYLNPASGFTIIDAISGRTVVRYGKLFTDESVANYMVEYWKNHTIDPVPEDLYMRWFQTANIARSQPGQETAIIRKRDEVAPTMPPRPSHYAQADASPALPSGWIQKSDTIWQKNTPGYMLDVQLYNGKYYQTVTDLSGLVGRRYIDNTPYNTLQDAINAATNSMIRHSSETTKAKMAAAMEQTYGTPVGIAGTKETNDNSIVAFREMLHYIPHTARSGEHGLIAKLGDNVYFFVTHRGTRYHTDVIVNGNAKALGNYNLETWAMYEGPYFWYQKNRDVVNFNTAQKSASQRISGSDDYVRGSGRLF